MNLSETDLRRKTAWGKGVIKKQRGAVCVC